MCSRITKKRGARTKIEVNGMLGTKGVKIGARTIQGSDIII